MYNVGIPAKNEEKTIESCIRSIFNQTLKPNKVIVCTNGCSDSTVGIVKRLQKEFVNLIHLESKKGKGNAWNSIRLFNTERLLLFVDADVVINKIAAEKLIKELEVNFLLIVGGSSFRLKPKNNWFTFLSDVAYGIRDRQSFLNGKLYLLDTSKLKEAETFLKINAMPVDILNEDQFLQKMAELTAGFRIIEDAYSTHHAISFFSEWIGFRFRVSRGRKQLLRQYPSLFPKSDFYSARIKSYLHRFTLANTFSKKLGVILFSFLKEVIGLYVLLFESSTKNNWNTVVSTKQDILYNDAT